MSMEFKPVVLKLRGVKGSRGAIVCQSMGELNVALGQIFTGHYGDYDHISLEKFVSEAGPSDELLIDVRKIIEEVGDGLLTHQDLWRKMGAAVEKYATAMNLPSAG